MPKRAVGLDRAGRVVFVHVRTPYSMAEFRRILASSEVGLAPAMYLEGGPEASLVVQDGSTEVRELGSYETGFWENDGNREFWDIPNVLGLVRR